MENISAELLDKIAKLCEKDPRYKPEAYLFVLAALHFTVSSLPEPRHVTGKELLEGIRIYGLEQFGPLTRQVFEHWGIEVTEDFGHIVFSLVDAGLLGKTEEDSLADFQDVYDFIAAFDPQPLYKLVD
ncbi:MAG: hypothetical protein NC819_01655 [Candidatus Omnitrophica bacterium]|nr:hypothetical protein [Candidatus Omnitrophota bacterium]